MSALPISEVNEYDITDITETRTLRLAIDPGLNVGEIIPRLVDRLGLVSDTAYALHDSHGRYLDEQRPIGEQKPDGQLTIGPKTHLG